MRNEIRRRMDQKKRLDKEAEWLLEQSRQLLGELGKCKYSKPAIRQIPESATLNYIFQVRPTLKLIS